MGQKADFHGIRLLCLYFTGNAWDNFLFYFFATDCIFKHAGTDRQCACEPHAIVLMISADFQKKKKKKINTKTSELYLLVLQST